MAHANPYTPGQVETLISTHSRAKAAGYLPVFSDKRGELISTHSRAKAAGYDAREDLDNLVISTHSRAKAAGC